MDFNCNAENINKTDKSIGALKICYTSWKFIWMYLKHFFDMKWSYKLNISQFLIQQSKRDYHEKIAFSFKKCDGLAIKKKKRHCCQSARENDRRLSNFPRSHCLAKQSICCFYAAFSMIFALCFFLTPASAIVEPTHPV